MKLWVDGICAQFEVAVVTLKLPRETVCSLAIEQFKENYPQYHPEHIEWIPRVLLHHTYPSPTIAGVWLVEFAGQTPFLDALKTLASRRPSSFNEKDTAIKPDRNGNQGRGGPGIKEDTFSDLIR